MKTGFSIALCCAIILLADLPVSSKEMIDYSGKSLSIENTSDKSSRNAKSVLNEMKPMISSIMHRQRELAAQGDTVFGIILVKFSIEANGSTANTAILENNTLKNSFADIIIKELSAWKFRADRDPANTSNVIYCFNFSDAISRELMLKEGRGRRLLAVLSVVSSIALVIAAFAILYRLD